MNIHQLSLFLENSPGKSLEPCRLLSDAGVNIRTLTLADTQQFGILRLIVSDWERGRELLQAAGYVVNVTEVVAVEVDDRPGGLVEPAGMPRIERRQHRIHVRVHLRPRRPRGTDFPFRPRRRGHRTPARLRHQRPGGARIVSVSRAAAEQMERSSWIRRMFEIGLELRRERGAGNVFDFTLGNPDVEPPEAVIAALRRIVAQNRPRSHGYMPNAGFPEVRAAVARWLAARTGLPFAAQDLIMTVGAAGAINIVLKAILDPGDEVIVLNPYFPEYQHYIENHQGRVVAVETDDRFQPDIGRIAAAITPRTKAIILNSPNNPTGAVYGEEILRELDGIVREPVLAISRRAVPHARFRRLRAARNPERHQSLRAGLELVEGYGYSGRTHRLPGYTAGSG